MGKNTSSAVMQQRNADADPFDFYPTPCWATRALLEKIESSDCARTMTVMEPACGLGYMTRPLTEFFETVLSMDIQDMGQEIVKDYLTPPDETIVDWTITNPPFTIAEEFINIALKNSTHGVAMFVRIAFVESKGRYETLFSKNPPTDTYIFTERVPLQQGWVDPKGSTATCYVWMVWRKAKTDGEFSNSLSQIHWIAPCRNRLEREGDYPAKDIIVEPIETTPLFGAGQ